MRSSQSFYWRWPVLFVLAVAALFVLVRQSLQACRLRGELAQSRKFQVSGSFFRLEAGTQQDLNFRIEHPLRAHHGLLLCLQQEAPNWQQETDDPGKKLHNLQKNWGNFSGRVEIFSADGRLVAENPLRLLHIRLSDSGGNLLPVARLPLLPPGGYRLHAEIITPPVAAGLSPAGLQLSCEICSLEYFALFLAGGIVLLLIPVNLLLWCKLTRDLFWFKKQRDQEKWLSEGVGKAKIMYVMTRYPLWSETFLRQDLQLLLKEDVPLEAMALFPGDCAMQSDWPPVRILSPQATGSGDRASRWRKLRCWIPARLQCSLSLLQYRQLLRELVRQGRLCHARHIHAEFADLGALLAAAAARRLAVSFSLGIHAADVYTNRYSLDFLCRKAKFITACNRAAGTFLVRKCPDAARKLHLIHHGLMLEKWTFRESWIAQSVPELFFAGRFVAKKGIPLLLEALTLLLQRGRRLRLTLAGSGPLEQELRQLAERLGLLPHIEWAGVLEREQVARRLKMADVFCLPSSENADRNQEGIPNVLVEAMAVGVPVVGSQSGGICELLTEETGWPIAKLSAEIFADTVEELLQNPAECEKRRRQARQRIEAEFSAARTVKARARLLQGSGAG